MTLGTSQISLCNRSLLSVGARAQIASLTEGSTEANACAVLFSSTFTSLARSAPWNCLKNQTSLTLVAAAQGTPENLDGTSLPTPPVPWLYSYLVPPDSLQIRYLLPPFTNINPSGAVPISPALLTTIAWYPGMGQIPYSVSYGVDADNNPREVILTNLSQAIAVYTINQQNPTIWDSLFESAFVASLAAYLVPALSLDLPLMDRVVRMADIAITQARTRDGNEGVTSQNRNASWMDARIGMGSILSGGNAPWGGYADMVWPG